MGDNEAVSTRVRPPISFEAIGYVELVAGPSSECPLARKGDSRIILRSDLVQGLNGLRPGQQFLVLYHFHLASFFELLQHPRGDTSRPRRGVFSLRSPHRPNPIGATVVEVLGVVGNVLWVRGLDALEGSPVLDLKPARGDRPR